MPTDERSVSLNAQLRELTGAVTLPEMIAETLARGAAELQSIDFGVAVGATAPDFRLPDQLGHEVRLADRLAAGPVVLAFYRGDWCPYCNLELRALQANLERIIELGASLLAISPQAPTNALSLAEKHGLGFEALSDVHQEVIRAYRLQYTVPVESQEIYRTIFGNDLSQRTADGTWSLPIPATFVLDGQGVVRVRHVDPDYRVRMEPDDIVSALRALVTT
jgi:peroxiredoxin